MAFEQLPQEVLRSIIGYMDIPSLAALSMTHKATDDNIAYLATDDTTWYALIQSRFGIGCDHRRIKRQNNANKKKEDGVMLVKRGSSSSLTSYTEGGRSKRRPKSYGGITWKDAYRSLATTMRIPETSISGNHKSGGAVFASPSLHGRNNNTKSAADCFGCWALVSHSENCRTKTVEGQMGRRQRRRNHHDVAREPNPLPYRLDRRYIELKLCFQNTKSGFGRVVIPDVSSIHIASLEEEDYFESWGWDKWNNDDYDPTFKLIDVGPWKPQIILKRRFADNDIAQQQATVDAEEWNAKCGEKDIILRPFEVVVLSVHISCPETFVYETDALSSMAMIRVPVAADGWLSINDVDGSTAVRKKDVAVARFLPEDEIWEYYCQLPGGCLSLTDRSRLVPM